MNGPKVVCCGCKVETALTNPICNQCMKYGFDSLIGANIDTPIDTPIDIAPGNVNIEAVHDYGCEVEP